MGQTPKGAANRFAMAMSIEFNMRVICKRYLAIPRKWITQNETQIDKYMYKNPNENSTLDTRKGKKKKVKRSYTDDAQIHDIEILVNFMGLTFNLIFFHFD